MKELKAIIDVVSRVDIGEIELVRPDMANSKLYELYELVNSRKTTTRDEAVLQLYGGLSTQEKVAFSKLKSHLKRRLFNTILIADNNPSNGVLKMTNVLLILQSHSKIHTANKLFRRLLPRAIQDETWSAALTIATALRSNSVAKGHVEEFAKMDQLVRDIQLTYNTLLELQGMFQSLKVRVIRNKSNNEELYELANTYEKRAKKLINPLPSKFIENYRHTITLFKHSAACDYAKVARTARKRIKQLDSDSRVDRYFYTVYAFQLLISYSYLHQYDRAIDTINKLLDVTRKGSFNWFQIQSGKMILGFYSKSYDELLPTYLDAIRNPKFTINLLPVHQETWHLYYAWLLILHKMGKITLSNHWATQFDLNDFLLNVTQYAKDKTGLNVNILAIKTIWWLLNEDYDYLVNADEQLNRYRSRYNRPRRYIQKRGNAFLKYLAKIYKRKFVDFDCTKYKATALKEINQWPIEQEMQNLDIEIVPFDQVIVMLDEIITKNRRRIRTPN